MGKRDDKGKPNFEIAAEINRLYDNGQEAKAEKKIGELYHLQDLIDPSWRDMDTKPLPELSKDDAIKSAVESGAILTSTESAYCYVYPEHPAIRQITGYYETLCCQFYACRSWYEKYHQQFHAYCSSNMREVYYYDKRIVPGLRLVQWGEYCTNCGWQYGPFYRYYNG